jgi:hypothetical protein
MPPLFILWLGIVIVWLVLRLKMPDYEKLQAVGLLVLVWLGLLFGFLEMRDLFPPPLNIYLALVSTIGISAIAIAYFWYTTRRKEAPPRIQDDSPMVSLIRTTKDRVHDVVDQTGSEAPLVSDEGGTENEIYDIKRREKDESKAKRKAQD